MVRALLQLPGRGTILLMADRLTRPSLLALGFLLSIATCLVSSACSDSEPEIQPGTEGWPCPNDNNCLAPLRCIAGTCQPNPDDAGPQPDAMVVDVGPQPDAGPGDGGPVDGGEPCPDRPAMLSVIQTRVFGAPGEAQCNQAACHGNAAAGGIMLIGPSSTVRTALLGPTQDGTAPERDLVVPGSPDDSRLYVIMKERAPGGQGGPMPPNAQVPFCDLESVRRWIAEGALDN